MYDHTKSAYSGQAGVSDRLEAMTIKGSSIYEVPVTMATFVVIQALYTWNGEAVRKILRQVECRLCNDEEDRFGRTNQ